MGVYLTHGLSGPNPRANGPRGRPTGQVLSQFDPQLRGHVSTREEEDQGGGSHSTRLARLVARPAGCHFVSYRLGQVIGAPPQPYKYPLQWKSEHTPLLGNSTCKALILTVVAWRSLVGIVART
jgi:hypothetical protein